MNGGTFTPTKLTCALCDNTNEVQVCGLAPEAEQLRRFRFQISEDESRPYATCAKCRALSVDEQRALVDLIFKNFCIKLLTHRGMSMETARVFVARAVNLVRTPKLHEENPKS